VTEEYKAPPGWAKATIESVIDDTDEVGVGAHIRDGLLMKLHTQDGVLQIRAGESKDGEAPHVEIYLVWPEEGTKFLLYSGVLQLDAAMAGLKRRADAIREVTLSKFDYEDDVMFIQDYMDGDDVALLRELKQDLLGDKP